ncbi:MAG: hypothetical protein H6983_04075 [Ectothiorhodospiraceae bacterium]|nr:hypothetical protein [Chromatiales bacterium]MCP5153320.1 hypothetical protein [Ectothiorhodospiraceae bacterium]
MVNTKVLRIDLAKTTDLQREIVDLSDSMLAGGFRLATSFVVQDQLVLVYQRIA